jgi:hypothetical protein
MLAILVHRFIGFAVLKIEMRLFHWHIIIRQAVGLPPKRLRLSVVYGVLLATGLASAFAKDFFELFLLDKIILLDLTIARLF